MSTAHPLGVFRCSVCHRRDGKYLGRCPSCGSFNAHRDVSTMVEGVARPVLPTLPWSPMLVTTGTRSNQPFPFGPFGSGSSGGVGGLNRRGSVTSQPTIDAPTSAVPLEEIVVVERPRLRTGVRGIDRVLAQDDAHEGPAMGSCVLVAGDPGAGKSTMLLQACGNVSAESEYEGEALYMSREESQQKIAETAARLGVKGVHVLDNGSLENFVQHVRAMRPKIAVCDSLQTVASTSPMVGGARKGSVRQVCYVAETLFELAHELSDGVIFIVCHITKNRQMAGPKTVDHWVDANLMLTLDRKSRIRILSTEKNRFGWDHVRARMTMSETGLSPLEPVEPPAESAPLDEPKPTGDDGREGPHS